MTNKTITLARVRAADSLYLTMWPNDTLHECETGNPKWNACLNAIDAGYTKEVSAALADPVPPAGGKPDPIIAVLKGHLADGMNPMFSGGDLKHLIGLLEVGTRLQAEVERLKQVAIDRKNEQTKLCTERNELQAEVELLKAQAVNDAEANTAIRAERDYYESELTKARELWATEQAIKEQPGEDVLWQVLDAAVGVLTRRAAPHAWESEAFEAGRKIIMARREGLIATAPNQSAPADKGQCESVACAHGIRAPHACDQCEAQNAVPDYWEDPDTGTCIDQWSKIQGLNGTEAYSIPLYRHAEQPAPVAVVMPEHRDSDLRSPVYGYERKVWNACLDEIARLNSEPKP